MTDSKKYTVRLQDGTTVGPVGIDAVKQFLLNGDVGEEDRVQLLREIFSSLSEAPELLDQFSRGDTLDVAETHDPAFSSLDILQGIPPAAVYVSEDLLATHRGQLEEVRFPRLLYFFHAHRSTGRLKLLGPEDYEVNLFFHRGTIEKIDIPSNRDDIFDRLLKNKLCNVQQLREVALLCEREGGELSDRLVGMRYVDPHGLLSVLRQQFCDQLNACFGIWEGPYFFFTDERPEGTSIPHSIEIYPSIQEGIKNSYDFSRLQWILEPFYNSSVKLADNPNISLEHLLLSPRQTRLLHMIEGAVSLWNLFELSVSLNVMEELSAHSFVFFLSQLELLFFDNHTLGPRIQDKMNLLEGRGPSPHQ